MSDATTIRELGLRGVPLHRWYLAIGGALLALYLLIPPFQGSPVLINFLSGSSAVAIVVGVRRNRPVAAWPWLLFALGQALFFLGDVYTYLYPKLLGHEVPFPSIGDGLYLAMYPVLMMGVLLMVRRRNPQGDRAGVIDALIITVGVGLLSWFFLMAPYVHDATLSPLAKSVSIAYPLGDVLLLAAVLRLVFDGGRRQSAFYLLVTAVLTLFLTDAAYGYALLDGTYNHQLIYDAGWIGYYLLWGSVALNPTMRNLVEATPDRERRLSRLRLALLTTASVMAPSIEIIREFHSGDVDLLVIMAASMLLFLLVIARVVGLVRQHERAVSRERALRSAGAALVSAATSEEIHAAALATAVALADRVGEVRLCLETPVGVVLFPDHGLPIGGFALAELEAAVGSIAGGPLGQDSRLQLELPASAARATVFPIAAVNRRRGLIVVASSAPLSPLFAQALQSLADSVSLALGSAELIEDMHRRESEARFGSLVRNASDLITVVDSEGIIGYQSPSIERILGYHPDEVHGTSFQELLIAGDRGRLAQLLGMQRRGGAGTYTFECTLCHADGRTIKFEVLATDLLDDEHVRGIVLNGRDVSERTAFQAQLAHQAFHDPVTSLPNRALFSDRVQHALTRADRERATVAVIFLDLDDFKTVNDSLGHSAGDDVLREVGRRLVEAIRSTDTAARFGGDEFAVLLEGIEGAEAAAEMADRIVAAFELPVQLKAKEIFVRPSLGIALAGPDSEANPADADELVRNADAAMYIAKRDGKGGYRVFETAMHASVLERLELRAELQRAIETNQFELYFQPLIELETGAISGIEALCRWHHPTRGLVQPGQFIPLAEEMGLIVEIGRWVLEEGCRQAAEFQASLPPGAPLRLGINLSVKQLQHPDIVADVRHALEASRLNPGTLVLEITESVMMADAALAARRLHELRALGARIAMDDFGTGYSSLSYLSHFPVDILKMDRSFLTPDVTIQASGLAAAIVSLGSTLSLEVVAEGIERPGQLQTLRDLGRDTGQGFLIARPMNAEATKEWLRETQSGGGFEGRRAA